MNLLSGLEKFGLSAENTDNLFKESEMTLEKTEETQDNVSEPKEQDFLLTKTVRCKLCEKTYQVRTVKSGRVKRLESDQDLRPRHQYIDTLKYSVWSCPYCGYTGLSRNIDELTSVQRKLIAENVCTKFTGGDPNVTDDMIYDYDQAIERYKLALFNCVTKKGKASELAYICLNISWLLRTKIEQMSSENEIEKKIIENTKKEENLFYDQAYEGFLKAVSSEDYPMCGMEQSTVDYLMAVMSYRKGKLDVATKFLTSILGSKVANRRIKDKSLELRDEIIAEIRAGKGR